MADRALAEAILSGCWRQDSTQVIQDKADAVKKYRQLVASLFTSHSAPEVAPGYHLPQTKQSARLFPHFCQAMKRGGRGKKKCSAGFSWHPRGVVDSTDNDGWMRGRQEQGLVKQLEMAS